MKYEEKIKIINSRSNRKLIIIVKGFQKFKIIFLLYYLIGILIDSLTEFSSLHIFSVRKKMKDGDFNF